MFTTESVDQSNKIMAQKAIRFFTPQDNTQTKLAKSKADKPAKPVKLEGYISPVGKLVIPVKTMDQIEPEADTVRFHIGTDQGKRKIKVIYLVPTNDEDSFKLVKAAKSYTVELATILQKGNVDYKGTKCSFMISPFDYQEGVVGYSLTLQTTEPKPPYTGKPRGRKPKAAEQIE